MVEQQVRARGISDARVLGALMTVPRERFVLPRDEEDAYEDRALPLDFGQTISQPYMVAYMTDLLQVTAQSTVLEIGTGSGYQCAILARLGRFVWTIERIEEFTDGARVRLRELGVSNVALHTGDGSLGLPEHAPYDRIIVTAGAPGIPPALIEQLADHGRLVIPIGALHDQVVALVTRDGQRITETRKLPCRFVKLIGRQGWAQDSR